MKEELDVKYVQAHITPFWKKLPFFFLFPFRFSPLVFLCCIVGASALAGLALGAFGLLFKGFLVYLGLRYGFNVLELFAKGRFEGESVDHRLWGPEKRPAKLGGVIALFIVAALQLGNHAVDARIAGDTRTQDILVERYKKAHAAELAQLEREREAFQRRIGLASPAPAAPATPAAEEDENAPPAADASAAVAEPEPEPIPELGPTREQMIEAARPQVSDPLWLRLLPAWYWMVVIALSLLLPAAAVVIALEDKFFKALNPLNVVYLVQAMGSAYFALWAFFLAIAGSRQLAFTAGASWPTALRFPLEMGVATYLGLVLFALMGYALYQFHQELHLDVEVDFDQHRQAGGAEAIAAAGSARAALQKAQPAALDPFELKLQALLAQGNVKEAIAEVKDRMRYDRQDPALNARLHALYLLQGDSAATLAHGQQLLAALARAGQGRQAVEALRKLLAIDPGFVVQDGDAILPAATAAVQERDFALAARLLNAFDRRFPGHKDLPAVYFLGARLLSEQSRQHDKAVRILQMLVAKFPEHGVAAEAGTYLKVLETMLAKTAGATAQPR